MKIKNLKSLLAWLPLFFILLYQLPEVFRHYRLEGTRLNQEKYFDLLTNAPIFYPPQERALTVFWASWCTPCLIEMNRLKSSVLAEKIPKGVI